jgi:hypothetical protein
LPSASSPLWPINHPIFEKEHIMPGFKIVLGIFWLAVAASAENLLLLPIAGDMDKSGDMATVNQLYRDVVESQFHGTLLPAQSGVNCGERDCALKAARESGAGEVIYSTVSQLGSKWVFSSTLVKVRDGTAFNQRLTVLSIEDFEAVTRRMADAILNHKTIEQAATVDNVTQKEETREPERRKSLSSSGVALGYLYPTNSKNFNNNGAVIRIAGVNNWELRNDLLLNAEIVWGATDASIGADLNLDYVFGRSDYSPFAGGGLGLHYVNSADLGDNKRFSGPALNVQGGLLLFRTYDVHVMLRGQYQVIFNDDMAQGFSINAVFTFSKWAF